MHLYIFGFIIYFMVVGMIGITAYFRNKKNQSGSDYSNAILGSRSINYFLTALSAHASDMSDWLFMAFPAALYAGGLVNAWIAIGLIVGMWITWKFIAPYLRRMTESYDVLTLSTFFERRFDDQTGIIRLLSACMCLLFFSVYIAAGLKGFGFLAESVFDLPYSVGTLIALACMIFYIILGGYRSLAWIDCFQALFLLCIIFVVPAVGFLHIQGWDEISRQAFSKQIPLTFFPDSHLGLVNTLLMAFSWTVGYFGTPHILTKFMGIKKADEISKARRIGMAWQISVLTAAGCVGLIGIAYFPDTLQNKELVFVEMVKSLFSPLITGFILSAVAGATLSVITAQVLVLVSVLTEDLYKGTLRPKASDKELLWVYRISILLVALLSFAVSFDKSKSIQELVHYAWMGFGCSFGPLVLLSLHSKYINRHGAYASIVTGGSIAALWEFLGKAFFLDCYGLDVPAVIPGFFLSIVFAYITSWVVVSQKK